MTLMPVSSVGVSSATVKLIGRVLTGASFTAVTFTSTTSVALENAVAPPLLPVSTLLPAVPLVWSQARKVSAATDVPL